LTHSGSSLQPSVIKHATRTQQRAKTRLIAGQSVTGRRQCSSANDEGAHYGPKHSRSLATHASGKMEVPWHDCHALGVNCAQICVLEQADDVGLGGFLKSQKCGSGAKKLAAVVLKYFSNKALEWKLSEEELGGLLVLSDLTKSNGAGTVAVALAYIIIIDAGCGGVALACGLGGQGLARCFATGAFAGSLFGTRHLDWPLRPLTTIIGCLSP